mmetsp:Transcript_80823/g.216694  ORF Transcript_80823/g.216694 Transcript_80823/m.216694 type:complete len:137 (+) Transcript_80823:365-775(+)
MGKREGGRAGGRGREWLRESADARGINGKLWEDALMQTIRTAWMRNIRRKRVGWGLTVHLAAASAVAVHLVEVDVDAAVRFVEGVSTAVCGWGEHGGKDEHLTKQRQGMNNEFKHAFAFQGVRPLQQCCCHRAPLS